MSKYRESPFLASYRPKIMLIHYALAYPNFA